MDDLRPRGAVARRHRLRHLSDRLGRPRSNTRCATAAPSIFIAEDQEYVDKILPLADRLPALRWIVVIDDSAMFGYDHPKLKSYRRAAGAGREPDLAWLERQVARARPDATRLHRLHLGHHRPSQGRAGRARQASRRRPPTSSTTIRRWPQKDHRTVAYLPLCHVLGRDVAVTLPLISRLVPHFGEKPGRPGGDAVRGGADRAVHRAALSAEIRLADCWSA